MFRLFTLAVLLISLSPALAFAEEKIAADPELAPLVDRWRKAATDLGIPGFAIVVVRDGKVALLETYGHADAAGRTPVTPDSAFYIASCTKTYTATAIMQLVDAGKIKLDEKVKTYLPQLSFSDDPALADTLTIRDLLSHRRGLDHDAITWHEAYTGQWDDQLFWRLFPTTKIAGQTQYSNLHYTILGRVVQAVSGEHWRDYLAAHVFKPAGMTRTTGYASQMYGWPATAVPTIRDGSNRLSNSPLRKADTTMHAAGGLGTSARDAGAWMLIHLSNGQINGQKILSPESVKEMQTLQAETSGDDNRSPLEGLSTKGFGLAWKISDYRGNKICSHGGGYVGARAHVSTMPDHNVGVFAMVNIGDAAGPFAELVAFDVYNKVLKISDATDPLPTLVAQHQEGQKSRAGRESSDAQNKKPVTHDTLSRPPTEVAGNYANADWGTIRVEFAGGPMKFVWGELQAKPTTTGNDAFEARFERVSTMTGRFEGNVIVMSGVDEEKEVRFTKE